MSKFTPGPWEVVQRRDQEWDIDAPSGDKRLGYLGWDGLAVVCGSEDDQITGQIVGEANARLIAAAPDLYDLLAECTEYIGFIPEGIAGGDEEARELSARVKAVLAKVEAE